MPSSSCCVGAAKNARRPREVYCYILIINIIIIIIVNIALSFAAGAVNVSALSVTNFSFTPAAGSQIGKKSEQTSLHHGWVSAFLALFSSRSKHTHTHIERNTLGNV